MGAGSNVNAFFGIMTMVISIPTGVKMFNWIFTMYKGRVKMTVPMLWFMGFVTTFTIGGITGVLMAVPPVDFQLHNSLFLVAHFHNMVIGGVVFGYFAGLTYWSPKVFGFKLNERLGRYSFWSWIIGFILAFVPLYVLGMMGATRRLDHYDASLGWQQLFIVAGVGVLVIGLGVVFMILQIIVSIIQRDKNRDLTGDPWNGRTLEWATASPVPVYNFATLPVVEEVDQFWAWKKKKSVPQTEKFKDIMLPKNTPIAMFIGLAAMIGGFAIIWHMYWLAVLAFFAVILLVITRTMDDETEYILKASEVKRMELASRVLSISTKTRVGAK
jgi:cytochrome o ubiquinol oxidase subunit 1